MLKKWLLSNITKTFIFLIIYLPSMVWYQKEWWKKLVHAKEHRQHIDSLRDIDAILDFLQEINDDVKELSKLFKKLEELEKERKVSKEGIVHINLETQAEVLDKILERYEFFENDVDINGLRVKHIAHQFLNNAQNAGLKDLVKERKQDQRWWMLW